MMAHGKCRHSIQKTMQYILHYATFASTWQHRTSRGQLRLPDHPWSLFEGVCGLILMYSALIDKMNAWKFPFFADDWIWWMHNYANSFINTPGAKTLHKKWNKHIDDQLNMLGHKKGSTTTWALMARPRLLMLAPGRKLLRKTIWQTWRILTKFDFRNFSAVSRKKERVR